MEPRQCRSAIRRSKTVVRVPEAWRSGLSADPAIVRTWPRSPFEANATYRSETPRLGETPRSVRLAERKIGLSSQPCKLHRAALQTFAGVPLGGH